MPLQFPQEQQVEALLAQRGNRAATIEPVAQGFINAAQVYPFADGAIYHVITAPERVTDIALQPGETLVAVASGDTVRWVIGDTKACGHLPQGDFESSKGDHGSEALISFLISGGDASKRFEAAEEVFDEMPPAIGVEVTGDLLRSVGLGRDYGDSAPLIQFSPQPIGVESLVAEEHLEFDVVDQRLHPDEVVALAGQ